MRPAAKYWSRIASTCFDTGGFTRYGRDVTGALPGGTVSLNGNREQEPKSVGELENTSWYSLKTFPRSVMTSGVQPGPCRLKVISRKWGGKTSHMLVKLVRCSGVRRSKSAEGGDEREESEGLPSGSPVFVASGRSCTSYTKGSEMGVVEPLFPEEAGPGMSSPGEEDQGKRSSLKSSRGTESSGICRRGAEASPRTSPG